MQRVMIENINQARNLVILFNEKINTIYKNLDENQNVIMTDHKTEMTNIEDITSKLSSDELEKFTNAVIFIQREIKKKTTEDTLIRFNSKGAYNPDAKVFTNKQNIHLNLNIDKQNQLITAYRNQNWQDSIFSDPLFLQTALSLFATGKLKNPEFETLLIMQYAKTPLPFYAKNIPYHYYPLNAFKILNEQDEFTVEARGYLLYNLPGFMEQEFNRTHIENFRLIAKAFFEIYPAENVFFIIKSAEYHYDDLSKQLCKSRLGVVLYHKMEPIKYGRDAIQKIIISCIVENALQLACFPIKDVVPVRSIAGELTTSDIERAVNEGLRPGAVTFPNVPRNKNIHELVNISDSTRRDHDWYHAKIMTKQGWVIRKALHRIKNLSRDNILQYCENLKGTEYLRLFSTATWELIDAEFSYFNSEGKNIQRSEMDAKRFCKALDKEIENRNSPILFDKKYEVTHLGIITFIDMVENSDLWKETIFNPEHLIKKYADQVKIVRELLPYFEKDNSKYNIFIFKTYTIFEKESFEKIIDLLKNNKDLIQEFEFKRNNLIKFIGLVNKNNKKILNNSTLAFNILQFLHGKNEVNKEFDFELYQNLFNNLLLIFFHFNEYPFILDKVYLPIYKILVQVMQENDAEKFDSLKSYISALEGFYVFHHNEEKSPLKSKLPLLLKIWEKFDSFFRTYKELQKGFLPIKAF